MSASVVAAVDDRHKRTEEQQELVQQERRTQPGSAASALLPAGLRGWLRWLYPRSRSFAALHAELALQHQQPNSDATFFEAQSREDLMKIHADKMLQYAKWAQEALPGTAPDVFKRPAPGTTKTFLDLGAAPGGLSCFLHGHLGWSGTSVSLGEAAGGMPMMYRGTPPVQPPVIARPAGSTLGLPKFLIAKANKAAVAASTPAAPSTASSSPAPTYRVLYGDVRNREDMAEARAHVVDFAMAGAVQDQSQRSADAEPGEFKKQLQGRVDFLCHQLQTALEVVADGGSVMFVIGPAECASLVTVTQRLRPFVRGSIRVLRTMHSNKSPVYVLATNLSTSDRAALIDVANAGEIVRLACLVNDQCNAVTNPTVALEEGDAAAEVVPPWFQAEFALLQEDLEVAWSTRAERLAQQRRYNQRNR